MLKVKILPHGTNIVVYSLLISVFNMLTLYINTNLYGNYNLSVTFLSTTGFRFVSEKITAVVYTVIILPLMYGLELVTSSILVLKNQITDKPADSF